MAVRVFPGNTADPDAFTEIVPVIRDKFGLDKLVLVGDRGMITTARIDALRKLNDDPDTATDFGWITALRAPDIAKLAAEDGPLQMSLFDTQDMAEITHPDFPGERLIACRNPQLAANAPANATSCWPRPTSCWPRSSPGWPRADCPAPTRSASRSAR